MNTINLYKRTCLVLGLLFVFVISGYAQPFTTGASNMASSISSVSYCSGDVYYFSFVQAANQNATVEVSDDGTVISAAEGWSTGSNVSFENWASVRTKHTTTYGSNTTIYFILDAGTNTVTFSLSAPSCSTAPTVTTTSHSSVGSTTASSGGNVTSDGGESVTDYGVCWNTSASPTTSHNLTDDGSGTGSFSSSLTGLSPGTTYYYRAYATNSVGTSYGSESNFTTDAIAPTVTTTSHSSVGSTTASSGGNVTSDGGGTVTDYGVCWSTSSSPTTSDNLTDDGSGTGSFSSSLSGLSPGTTYYYRAYAINEAGTSYGSESSFTTDAIAPTVTTTSHSSVGSTTVSSGGNVTSDGGGTVTDYGVCWSTSSSPTTSDNLTDDGSGTGSFSSSLTGLSPGTTYYYRAYAINEAGTAYGSESNFTTDAILPTVTTTAASSISCSTASSGGNVTSDGGGTVTDYGVCWSTSTSPTISDNLTDDGSGTGAFGSSLTSLAVGTTYYIRAYATNSIGTAYGSEESFTALTALSAGTVGSAQSICYNATPASLTNDASPTGATGAYTYQWQSSSNNSSWSDIGSATSITYAPGALTSDTYYRRAETSGTCGTVYTASIKITVYADLSAGTIGSAETICYNSSPATLTNDASPTGGTSSYTYQWQSSTDNSTWGDIGSATSATYSPGALTTNTYYRRGETSGSCGTVYSSSILITVYSELTPGAIGF